MQLTDADVEFGEISIGQHLLHVAHRDLNGALLALGTVGTQFQGRIPQPPLSLTDQGLSAVSAIDLRPLATVLAGLFLGLRNQGLDLLFTEVGSALNADALLATRRSVRGRHLQEAVGVNVKGDLNLRDAPGGRGDAGELETAQALVAIGHLPLPLEHVNFNRALIRFGGAEEIALAHRDGGVAGNQHLHHPTNGLQSQGERGDVVEHQIPQFTGQDSGLNGGTNRDNLVGVHRLTGLQGHKGAHHLLHHRHSGGAPDEDHIVDVLRRKTGIAERPLHRAKQTIEQVRAEAFEGAALEAGLDMQGAVLARRDEGQGNRGALHTTEFDLGLLGRLGQPLEGLAIAAQINLVLLLEGISQPVDDPTVPVVSAELGVSTGGLDVEDPLGNAQDRDVKGAATQVKDQHAFDRAAIKSVGKGRRGGLVQDPLNRNPSQTAGITGGLTLGIVEIGGDRDHRGLDGLTEEGAGVVHQLAEHAGHQFFRRVFPLSGGADHTDIALIVGANGVGDGQAAVVQLIPLTANKTLEIGEGVARVQHELAPGQLTNKQFLVFAEADH